MVDAQRKARVLSDYEDLHVLADSLAARVEECWLGSWLDASRSWQMSSVRAVEALNDACLHLQNIVAEVRATPTDS